MSEIDIVVPQVGEATAEVVLSRWLKEEGEAVRKGEALFEVDTDKYIVEIEAFESGILAKILAPGGSEVMPLQVVARLVPDAALPRPKDEPSLRAAAESPPEQPAPAPARDRPQRKDGGLASPKARRLAAELGVEIGSLAGRGTGPGGLITADDISSAGVETWKPGTRPLPRQRRAIAARMVASKREVPHFYLLVDVDMGEALRLREHCGRKLGWVRPPSVTDLVAAACGRALALVPEVNVSYRDGALTEHAHTNVGVAVSTDDGLVVPVIRDADSRGLQAFSEEARSLASRAREGRLKHSDLGERSLVVSNLGMHGVDAFVAIIDMPDPMILAVGRLVDRCVPVGGAPAVRPMCTLTLSADHRAFDGVLGARFLGAVREALEDPWRLLEGEEDNGAHRHRK